MGELVRFDQLKRRGKRWLPDPPPDDPLARASWLHDLLCAELSQIVRDDRLSDDERRELVLKFAARITQATPHDEIAKARDEVRGDEGETKGRSLGGVVSRATGGGTRPVRAAAPRRKQ